MSRRFPPPWTSKDNGSAFIVKDGSGFALAYVYYEDDDARRIAANNVKLPGLFGRPQY